MSKSPGESMQAHAAIPKGPVFSWSSLARSKATDVPSVEDLKHIAFTTSGRAAIYQALLQMELAPGSKVLLPTYHCPTMVAPVLLAGHVPSYFGLRDDGLPDLARIAPEVASGARAMLVSQYFGLTQSLHEVRDWCDARGVLLIEDCAHSYFGQAGGRPVGAWGDYCTASLSKFFPVPEAGLLGSAHHQLKPLRLDPQRARAELKGWIDAMETAAQYGRLRGLNTVLGMIFRLKGGLRLSRVQAQPPSEAVPLQQMMEMCDMDRIGQRVLNASMLLHWLEPRARIVAARARNFSLYKQLLSDLPNQYLLGALPNIPVAPYVFPVWVDDADRVYQTLRRLGVPVFRWDRIWDGTPSSTTDAGPRWSQHLLQFLCHQDLREADIRYSALNLLTVLDAELTSPRHHASLPEFSE